MSTVISIFRRELQAYFVSPIAYTVIVVFLGITAFGVARSMVVFSKMPEVIIAENGLSIRTVVMADLRMWANLAMILSLPAISMRLLSEERKNGTAELLMTSPISTPQLVLGKYLGTLTVLAMMLALTAPYIAVLAWKGSPEWAAVGGAYLAFFLYGAVILAVGLFASSLSENQIVALVLTYALVLPLWLIELLVGFMGEPFDTILASLSISFAMRQTALGLLNTHYVILDLGLILLFLFLCAQVIDSNRWR